MSCNSNNTSFLHKNDHVALGMSDIPALQTSQVTVTNRGNLSRSMGIPKET
jgi:hypothetical protein